MSKECFSQCVQRSLRPGFLAMAVLLCLPFVACQQTKVAAVSPYSLASFHASLGPVGNLNPPVPNQAFGPNTMYWMKAGERLNLEWDIYNLDLQCKDNGADAGAQSDFSFNLCSTVPGCVQMTGVRGASCILENGGTNGEAPYTPPGECKNWPPNHDIVLINSDSPNGAVPAATNTQSLTPYHVGPDAPNVWLVERPCTNGVCFSDLSRNDPQIKKQRFLWAEGCSPTTVQPIDPGVSGNADDVNLQLIASSSTDPIAAPFLDDQPSRTPDGVQNTLSVMGVGSFPRPYNRFVKFTRSCDPVDDHTQNSCGSSDSAEAQYSCSKLIGDPLGCVDQTSNSGVTHEFFSSKVRVKDIRVYGDQDELAFCVAFIKGQPRAGSESAQTSSDCNASTGKTDCTASPSMGLNFTPAHDWKITFDKGSSRCPDDPARSAVYVQFTLEAL